MTYTNWRDAVSAIRRRTASCGQDELALGLAIGVQISETLPRIVAAARLKTGVERRLGLSPRLATESQQDYVHGLAEEASYELPRSETDVEVRSWIEYFYLKRREDALCELRLVRGDVVSRSPSDDEPDEVVSIGDNGVVYFTGGGSRAWPDTLTVVARSDDSSCSARIARRTAVNRASDRRINREWSLARAESLSNFEVNADVDEEDLEVLRRTIEAADDEAPIQRQLQQRPHLLTALLRGRTRYCLPQVSFGGRYVADFLLADVDSGGIRWILVELETPHSSVTLSRGNDFDRYARRGVRQIMEWREWLQNNLDQARRPRSQDGLGLPDIRPQARALVLVGRRDRLGENAGTLRSRLFEESIIEMHTYDWLLERVDEAREYPGPPP